MIGIIRHVPKSPWPRVGFRPFAHLHPGDNLAELIAQCSRQARAARKGDDEIAAFREAVMAAETYDGALDVIRLWFEVTMI